MNSAQSQQAMRHYVQAYQQLYRRSPKDLRLLSEDWVIVSGARMPLSELEFLTQQLQLEHAQLTARRTVVHRLINWFTKH
jgi:hypothetical protein